MGRLWKEIPVGATYGRLTVTGLSFLDAEKSGRQYRYVPVECSCEPKTQLKVIGQNLIREIGGTRSCGCLRVDAAREAQTEHGLTDHPLHSVWSGLDTRCNNPNASNYADYGGRGITVDERWASPGNFMAFYEWGMSNGYKKGLHIDRINNDLGYSPENCRWVTAKENNRNKREKALLKVWDQTKMYAECVEQGLSEVDVSTLHRRIQSGWHPEEALTTRPREMRRCLKAKTAEKATNPTKPKRILDWDAINLASRPLHSDALNTPLKQYYGYFTVLGEAVHWPYGTKGRMAIMVPVLCRCGNEYMVHRNKLITGTTKSCGCYRTELIVAFNTKHGGCGTTLYSRWWGMKNRCYNSNVINYPNYGGRGIRVCDEWRENFAAFRAWAEENGFEEEREIDRTNSDGNYEPANCRWVTPRQNQQNRTNNVSVSAWGETRTIAEWSRDPRCVVSYGTLLYRLQADWSIEDALTVEPGETPQ